MLKYRMFCALSILFLSMSIYGINAQIQYFAPPGAYESAVPNSYPEAVSNAISDYSEYFTVPTTTASRAHMIAPQKYDLQGQMPVALYPSGQNQAVPYAQYQAAYPAGSSLWIQGRTSWTQRVVVPQGAFISLIALSSAEGYGYLHETYPDGRLAKDYYYFYPVSQMGFYADTVGQHILLFIIGDQVSNAIVIDVVGNYLPGYSQPVREPSYIRTPSYTTSYPLPYEHPFYYYHGHGHNVDNVSPRSHERHPPDNVSPRGN